MPCVFIASSGENERIQGMASYLWRTFPLRRSHLCLWLLSSTYDDLEPLNALRCVSQNRTIQHWLRASERTP